MLRGMNHVTALVGSLLTALVIVAISGLVFEGCQRSADREQETQLKCMEQAESSAEAVICRNRVTPA